MLPPQNFYTLVVPARPNESYAALVARASESETERKRGIGGVESRYPLRNPFALPLEYAQALHAKLDTVRRLQCSLLAVPPVQQQQQQSNASAGEGKAASSTPPSAPDTPPPALTRTLPPGGARAVEEAPGDPFFGKEVKSAHVCADKSSSSVFDSFECAKALAH